eukprot:CAMPEP_0117551652 /NCGR_PEP_ID=MMETSP0784-20121206/49300_1 /TAXON_ID=39447 /ORGANISM="" /LENGTH=208 /DNA_ID=CAMNT_0005348695 /DNA_START=95 /DNA_END=717 /DNA_ORIENTATION=-
MRPVVKNTAAKRAHETRRWSIAVIGDSNAVGYRKPPLGTRGYLAEELKRRFSVGLVLGRTRLTVLKSDYQFLRWAKEKTRSKCDATDYTVLVLGTNDVTKLPGIDGKSGDAQLFQRVRVHLRASLAWIRRHTARAIFVVEPLNEMPKKVHFLKLVAGAMRKEVAAHQHAKWIPMQWAPRDLQRKENRKVDPRHFSRAGVRRLARAIEG